MKDNLNKALSVTKQLTSNSFFALTATAYNLVTAVPHVIASSLLKGFFVSLIEFERCYVEVFGKYVRDEQGYKFTEIFKKQGFKNLYSLPISILASGMMAILALINGFTAAINEVVNFQSKIIESFIERSINVIPLDSSKQDNLRHGAKPKENWFNRTFGPDFLKKITGADLKDSKIPTSITDHADIKISWPSYAKNFTSDLFKGSSSAAGKGNEASQIDDRRYHIVIPDLAIKELPAGFYNEPRRVLRADESYERFSTGNSNPLSFVPSADNSVNRVTRGRYNPASHVDVPAVAPGGPVQYQTYAPPASTYAVAIARPNTGQTGHAAAIQLEEKDSQPGSQGL